MKTRSGFKRYAMYGCCTVLLGSQSLPAFTATRDLALEEVVVTAQKREQNAMTVPVTIDTFAPQDIEKTGALTLEDIQSYIPGFQMGSDKDTGRGTGVTQAGIQIRGISSSNISTGGDPSVATFLDGVYLPRAAITVPFSDIERIEVLKGPQGTLFGRNAAAGVVNIIPNSPAPEFEGFLFAKLGNYDLRRYEAMLNVPVTDTVSLRANALSNRRDAVVDNKGPAKPDPREQDNRFARLAVKWDITERIGAQLAYDYDKVDNGPQAMLGVSREHSNYPDPTDRKLNTDAMGGGETRDMDAWTAKFRFDISERWSMKTLSGYRRFETYNLQDEDGTAVDDVYVDTNNLEDSDILYNEIQFNYAGDFLDLVVGANHSREDTYQLTTLTFSYGAVIELASDMFGIPPAVINSLIGGAVDGRYVTESMTNTGDFTNRGLYADADFTITDRLNTIVGLRYSEDDKTFTWYAPISNFEVSQAQGENFFFNTDGVEEGSESWNEVTGRVVVNYQITESAMTFASYSTGYKSGGFDSINPGTRQQPLAPEEVKNIELGVKGDFLQSRLRTQVALFAMEIIDRQEAIESQEPGSSAAVPKVINTDEDIKGIEITADWLITESLRTGVVYTYRRQESNREAHYDAQGDFQPDERKKTTTPTEYTVTLDWSPEIPFGALLVHLDYIFDENNDRENEDHEPAFDVVPGYGDDTKLLNARLAWTSIDGHYELALWGRNLLGNERVSQPGGLTGDVLGTYHVGIVDPLTYGIDLKYVF